MNPSDVLCSFLLSLTITASVIAIESPSPSSSCHPGQKDALSLFNQSFSISGPPLIDRKNFCKGTSKPKTASWRMEEDCCSWEGVTCDNSTGDVVGLDLFCAGLRGAFDSSSSLFSLYHLRRLDLAGNQFIGILPPEIAQLSKLFYLDLSYSGLEIQNHTMKMLVRNLTELEELNLSYTDMSAVTPPTMMNFSSSLISLFLSDCSLGGKFPDYIFQLPNIQTMGLSGNSHLSGTLAGFNWSSSLSYLSLAGCSFTGEVPHSMGNLPRLTYLDISGNNFTGHLDLWTFSTLKNLKFFRISGLSVSDEDATDAKPKFPKLEVLVIVEGKLKNFPCFLSGMPKLIELFLESSIVSEFPDQCVNNGLSFPQLDKLVVRFCNLTKFPSLSQLKKLRFLDLRGNKIKEIPGWFGGIHTDLQFLDLSNNSLMGPLPLPSYETIYYSVSKNNFTGEIPSLLCNAPNLKHLDLSNNGLTGTLPPCLKNITKHLVNLNVRANKFHGWIPEIFPEGRDLTYLDFSMNQFEGPLPRSLSNCQRLEVLNVGSNKIVDSFPNWLGGLPLKILSLRSNELHGPVSISGGNHSFSRIRILDLSNNSFDGNLPDNLISGMIDMMLGDYFSRDHRYNAGSNAGYMVSSFSLWNEQFFSVMIDMKGVEADIEKINAQFAMLDLSRNRFHGEIPRSIGLLKSLTGLDFSHNGFTGTIPPSLGDLTNLESLDLSLNNLVGEIPKELAKLTFLGFLNLSWNNLTGTIPPGGHFNTFPNGSFEGNPGLCGIPLMEACNPRPPPNQRGDRGEDTGGWFDWKFVGMGFGSGIGIGITLGYMALETGRPLWLSRMVIRLEALLQ